MFRLRYYIRMDYRSPSLEIFYTLFKHARKRIRGLRALCHVTTLKQERDIIKLLLTIKWLFPTEQAIKDKVYFANVPGQTDKLAWIYQHAGKHFVPIMLDDNIINITDANGVIIQDFDKIWAFITQGINKMYADGIPWLTFGTKRSVRRCYNKKYSNKLFENSSISDGIVALNNPLLHRSGFHYKPIGYGYDDIDFNRQLKHHLDSVSSNNMPRGTRCNLFAVDKGKDHIGSWKVDVVKKFVAASVSCNEEELIDHVTEIGKKLSEVPEVVEGIRNFFNKGLGG